MGVALSAPSAGSLIPTRRMHTTDSADTVPGSALDAGHVGPFIEQTRRLLALEPNWDSYGAEVISGQAVETAIDLVSSVTTVLGSFGAAAPFAVVPVADGGIQVEWKGPVSRIEVEIGPDRALSYLVIDDEPARALFTEAAHVSQSEVMLRIARVILPQNGG
jgi:hypothetical protein